MTRDIFARDEANITRDEGKSVFMREILARDEGNIGLL